MKKRVLALVLAISCTVFMTACGDSELSAVNEIQDASSEDTSAQDSDSEENAAADDVPEQSTQDDTEEAKDSVPNTPETLSDDLYDFQVSIEGTVYQFPMWYSDFEALGWEYKGDNTETLSSDQYTGTQRWEKDGVPVYTVFGNLSMNTAAFSDCMVAGIRIDKYYLEGCDWEILLPGGIQYGVSTTDDIKEAYGDPTSDYDGSGHYDMTYRYDYYRQIELSVSKDSGVLEEIRIDNLVELEGADNSVSAEVPDVIKNYQAPTELGNDLYSFHVEFEGNLYKLPCPVSEFLANGFTIDESNSDMEVASGSSGDIALRYNNQTLRVQTVNFADYATTIENCMVTRVASREYGPDFAITIPGNIKIGDSEDSLKAATADYDVELLVANEECTFYNIFVPNSLSDRYSITVKNGIITDIEVTNTKKPE